MATSADLRPPRDWRNATFRECWLRVIAVAGGVSVLAAPVIAVREPAQLALVAFGFGVIGMAHLVTYGRRIGRGEPPRRADGGGLELPFSRIRQQAEWVADAGLFVAAAGLVASPDGEGRVVGAILLALVVFSPPRPRRLVLTPRGVTYAYGRTLHEVAWPDVAEVEADRDWVVYHGAVEWHLYVRTKKRGVVRTTRGGATKREALMRVEVDYLALDPSLAYWAISYYAEHPDARDELADDRALDRIARGALT